jgi:hypothetical protein
LGFLEEGYFPCFLEGFEHDLPQLVADDARRSASEGRPAWWMQYEKAEKRGAKIVADLKAPPADFVRHLETSVERWCEGKEEYAGYATAYGTSVAVDGKGNTKPTAFHFTAANQKFLESVESIRTAVTQERARASLFEGATLIPGPNLRWDPKADRNWALMAADPNTDGTSVDPTQEWLAFRALPLLPTFPVGSRAITTGVSGRGDEMAFSWPLWNLPTTLNTVRSLLQFNPASSGRDRSGRGVFAVCRSAIRRSSQGFGNFAPADVT